VQLEKNQIIKFFSDLEFNEPLHEYSVKGEKLNFSVSKLYQNFTEKTDFDSIAKAIDKRDKLPDGFTKIYWDLNSQVSLAIGTKAHYFGETFVYNRNLKPTDGYEEAIVKFWKSLPKHIVPFCMELKMYHKKYKFAGTGDIILYNTKTKKFIVCDYKTNKNLFKNFKKKMMLSIFSHLLDMPISHYKLQLSFYQILFEQTGFEVEARKIIHLKSDGNYIMYDSDNYTLELKTYLENNTL
jgi:hypothetical protein